MPRHLSVALLYALALGLCACGGSADREQAAEEAEAAAADAPADAAMTGTSPCFLRAVEASASGATARERGELFLAANGQCEGVMQTASGLQYEVIVPGDGPRPTATSTVTVNYEGSLLNGSVFDSSYERGEPISFPLDRVIAGWTEGVALMPVGSTYRLYIPSGLAYGPSGSGQVIGPDETLVFNVELLGIVE